MAEPSLELRSPPPPPCFFHPVVPRQHGAVQVWAAEEQCLFSVPRDTLLFMFTPCPGALDPRSTAILLGLTEPLPQRCVV